MTRSMSIIAQFSVVGLVAVIFRGIDAKPPARVVGGQDGNIVDLPYQVSMSVYNQHICGGTIITKRHILTAAHCVNDDRFDPIEEMTILTGSSSKIRGTGQTNYIKTVTVHPHFSDSSADSWRNDIAVISLTEDIDFDESTQPARLPTEDTPAILDCVASGWGAMAYPSDFRPTLLKKATFMTIDNESCRQRRLFTLIHDTHLCAVASYGVGLCHGDSGGPLAHNGVVVGIASFVTPCATGIPDVFTRVYSYLDFINQAIATT